METGVNPTDEAVRLVAADKAIMYVRERYGLDIKRTDPMWEVMQCIFMSGVTYGLDMTTDMINKVFPIK